MPEITHSIVDGKKVGKIYGRLQIGRKPRPPSMVSSGPQNFGPPLPMQV